MEHIIYGLVQALQPMNLLIMVLSLSGGIMIGALPGLSATMGVALLVPLTFGMEPASGLLMLGAMYCGAIYGGANSAILINTPGTPSAVCTTFDGYPLAKQGRADEALMTALVASVIGGLIGTVFLLVATEPLAQIALKFGSPEYFWMAIFGLTIIASLCENNLLKGLLAAAIGLILATIGIDPITGHERFIFGFRSLIAGISTIPAMIGLFSFTQVLVMVDENAKYLANYQKKKNSMRHTFQTMFQKYKLLLLRSSVLGSIVGILPGAGGNIASFIAYNESKRFAKDAETYGKGAIGGMASSESANNAVVSSSLIPLLALGIPGSPVAAVLMGGLLAHGLTPGTKLFVQSGDIAYTFIVGLFIINILMLFVGALGMRLFVKILNVPSHYVAVVIAVLSVIGSYAIRNSLYDVVIMLISGVVGFVFLKIGIEAGPLVLGLILGSIVEVNFSQALLMSKAAGGLLQIFVFRPICLFFIVLCIISVITPFLSKKRQKKQQKGA